MSYEPFDNHMEYQPDPEDDLPQYPYQDFYGTGGGKPRGGHHHNGWWILLILVLVIGGAAGVLSRYSIDIRQTGSGYSVSIQDGKQDAAAAGEAAPEAEAGDAETEPVKQPPTAMVGTGAQLTLSDTPRAGLAPIQSTQNGGMTLQQIYKKVIPSVVSITAATPSGTASGTGIIMSPDGYVITNHHVIDGAVSIEVLTSDDQQLSASLVGSDETSDLAVLKVAGVKLTAAEFGDSEQMEVGDEVVAIGDPLGRELRGTMTDGIISAINRDLSVNGRKMTLMQTNAALNNGNSGGPLINSYGQVIGINTMKLSSYYSSATVEGLGFAIPISTAKPIVDELIEKGYVAGRPALGINGRTLPNAAQAYYHLPNGVYVETVDPSSDAYQRGIQVGDIITAIAGQSITDMDGLNVVKNQYQAGDTITLTIFRKGEYYDVDVTLMDAAAY